MRMAPITEENLEECIRLNVAEEQRKFVATNLYSLAQAYVYPNTAHPFALCDGEKMVGFAMLEMDETEQKYALWRFMIDARFQGKGYGRAALALLIAHMRSRGAQEISLSYVPGNEAGEHLYRAMGFVPTGDVDGGEIVMKVAF